MTDHETTTTDPATTATGTTATDGVDYLDFTTGIGVTSTGHCHPRVVAAARERECKRRKTEQRNARQQRWRATTRSTGKAKAPAAATHTPPLQDTLF